MRKRCESSNKANELHENGTMTLFCELQITQEGVSQYKWHKNEEK